MTLVSHAHELFGSGFSSLGSHCMDKRGVILSSPVQIEDGEKNKWLLCISH